MSSQLSCLYMKDCVRRWCFHRGTVINGQYIWNFTCHQNVNHHLRQYHSLSVRNPLLGEIPHLKSTLLSIFCLLLPNERLPQYQSWTGTSRISYTTTNRTSRLMGYVPRRVSAPVASILFCPKCPTQISWISKPSMSRTTTPLENLCQGCLWFKGFDSCAGWQGESYRRWHQ